MATKQKHHNRSKRSSHVSKSGMYRMDQNSEMKTMARRRLKEAAAVKEENS